MGEAQEGRVPCVQYMHTPFVLRAHNELDLTPSDQRCLLFSVGRVGNAAREMKEAMCKRLGSLRLCLWVPRYYMSPPTFFGGEWHKTARSEARIQSCVLPVFAD